MAEIYDFEVGDEFHINKLSTWSNGAVVSYLNKQIVNKYYSTNNDTLFYEIGIIEKQASSPLWEWDYLSYAETLVVTNLESQILPDIDSVYTNPAQYNGRKINYKEVTGGGSNYMSQKWKYVNGCGEAYYNLHQIESGNNSEFEVELNYYKKGNEEWGTPQLIVPPYFINQSATWNVAKTFPNANPQNPNFVETTTKVHGFIGDTIIGSETWAKLYSTVDPNFMSGFTYHGSIKEEDGIVFLMDSTGSIDTLYNFNLQIGDSVKYEFGFEDVYLHVESIYEILINSVPRKRINFEEPNYPPFFLSEAWIEGIGSIHGPLFPKYPALFSNEIPDSLKLTCYKVDSSIVWNDPDYEDCYVSILLSTKEQSAVSINLFPNPTKDYIQVSIANNKPFSAEVLSLSGRVLKTIKRTSNQTITISELKPGIYILKIEQDGQQIFKKLIKE